MARTASWEEFTPAMGERGVMMYAALGYPESHPDRAIARAGQWISCSSLAMKRHTAQPCLSPVWDTSLVAHALLEGR